MSAGHAGAVDVVIVVAAVARGRKAIVALSAQEIVPTAFITRGTGCRGLLPGDDAGLTVRTFTQIPIVKTNILEYAQIWVEFHHRAVHLAMTHFSLNITRARWGNL